MYRAAKGSKYELLVSADSAQNGRRVGNRNSHHVARWQYRALWLMGRGRRFTVTLKLSFGWEDVVALGSIQSVARSESMGCVPVCPEHRRTSPRLRNGHFLAILPNGHGRPSPLRARFRPMEADLRCVAQSSSGNSVRPHCPLRP